MRRIAGLAALVAALVIAGCGGSDNSSSSGGGGGGSSAAATSTPAATDTATATTAASGSASTLKIAADPSGAIKFTTTSLTAKAGNVTVDFSNQSSVPHGVVIEGNGVNESTKVVMGADAPPITVDLKPGTYTYYCPVGDHRAEGMEGKLVVR